ncbi:hypothetical protein RJ55_05929 [Drechmeria coniospora]|nr:hypothetical protein RJ55_05929 [Drechmeria coniospora]
MPFSLLKSKCVLLWNRTPEDEAFRIHTFDTSKYGLTLRMFEVSSLHPVYRLLPPGTAELREEGRGTAETDFRLGGLNIADEVSARIIHNLAMRR